MSDRQEGAVYRWLTRPCYFSRRRAMGPVVTNFGLLLSTTVGLVLIAMLLWLL